MNPLTQPSSASTVVQGVIAVGGDHICRQQVVGGQPVSAHQQAEASA